MGTSFSDENSQETFLAVFQLHEMPGVVAFDSTADAIDFLETSADLDELSPLGVVEWDQYRNSAKEVYWQYSSSISPGMIMATAFQGYVGCRN
ncbi:hypothetical protein [Spirosoma gilvum]